MPSSRQYDVLAGRYAQGLLGALAEQPDTVDEIAAELSAVAALVAGNRPLRTFLEGPNIPQESKVALVDNSLAGKVQPMLLEFLHLLLRKNRVEALGVIAEVFQRLVEERHNQLRTRVIAAIALREDALDRLKRALDASTGKDCILEPEVDPGIIGGLVVYLGDRVIDGSIRTALDDLRRKLLEAPL